MNAMSGLRLHPESDDERTSTQTLERDRPRILAGGQLVIHRENAPLRCEICHQSDLFDSESGECLRCAHLGLPATDARPEARHVFDVFASDEVAAFRRRPPLYFLDEYVPDIHHNPQGSTDDDAHMNAARARERAMQFQFLGHMIGVASCVLALGVFVRFCLAASGRGDALIATFLCFILCIIAFLTMSVFVSAAAQTMQRLYARPRRERE